MSIIILKSSSICSSTFSVLSKHHFVCWICWCGCCCSNDTALCFLILPSSFEFKLLLRKLPGREPLFSLLRLDDERWGWREEPRRLGRFNWCTDSALALRPTLPTDWFKNGLISNYYLQFIFFVQQAINNNKYLN